MLSLPYFDAESEQFMKRVAAKPSAQYVTQADSRNIFFCLKQLAFCKQLQTYESDHESCRKREESACDSSMKIYLYDL